MAASNNTIVKPLLSKHIWFKNKWTPISVPTLFSKRSSKKQVVMTLLINNTFYCTLFSLTIQKYISKKTLMILETYIGPYQRSMVELFRSSHRRCSIKKVFLQKPPMQMFDSTAEKMKFFINDFFNKFYQIRSFLGICSYFLKNSVMENFIFCAMQGL